MQTTKINLTGTVARDGWAGVPVRLQGDRLETIAITEDLEIDPEDGPGWCIASDEETTYASDEEDVRAAVACMAREIRNARTAKLLEDDTDNARDFVESLLDDGKAADVLRALKAANLI
jgi:hypothetical protein